MNILQFLLQSNWLENIHSTGGDVSLVVAVLDFGYWNIAFNSTITGALLYEYTDV